MSSRWPAGVIRKTPVTPAGPLQNGAAPGVWTLAEATYWQKQGLWPIAGNFLAVEDVFSTYLYTGNGSTQTITNGIDLSGNGGLVWLKNRANTTNHILFDTARNAFALSSNLVNAEGDYTGYFSFTSSGFSVGAIGAYNQNNYGIASWSFRKAPKFFDVVTYNGTGTSSQTLSHSLGVAPGLIIVKRTNSTDSWKVYHRGLASPNTSSLLLNNTTAATNWGIGLWGQPSATSFAVNNASLQLNTSGGTYVAYLFAHDATADGIIQCGSYTGNGSSNGPTVNLGWEPQYLMIKNASGTGNWQIVDNMRGTPVGAADATLQANLINAESSVDYVSPTATGFQIVSSDSEVNTNSSTYIYIAIRRGPMKTPTVGTSVFSPYLRTGTGANATINVGFTVDTHISKLSGGGNEGAFFDRMRGPLYYLRSTGTNAETFANASLTSFADNTGVSVGVDSLGGLINFNGSSYINWAFRRAPGFFDVVCYTGTGVARTVNHNLGVAPELMIVKVRNNGSYGWFVYAAPQGATKFGRLDLTNAFSTASTVWNDTVPTASVFSLGAASGVNDVYTYVAYLFASCPGVSKVGSYTGNGSSQTINCGFSSGARFFLVKRTDSTGDWWVWDSARGITAPADPALALNSTASAVTSADAVDPTSTGIIVNQETTCNINVNGATYIFLAIA